MCAVRRTNDTLLKSAMRRSAKSSTRPGVPTRMCTGLRRRRMSSRRDVPPVDTMHCVFMCLPSSFTTADVCNASSRVGTKINAERQKRREPG